jgi:hypothetical protein
MCGLSARFMRPEKWLRLLKKSLFRLTPICALLSPWAKPPTEPIANLKLLGGVDKVDWFKPTIEELAKGIWAPESKSLTSTTRRSRNFDTPVGVFSYTMLKPSRYAVGAFFETVGKIPYLTASPEKALVDKVWSDKRFNGRRIIDFDDYLSDDLRIDRGDLSKLDHDRLLAISKAYDSAKINNLVRHIQRLKEKSHA